MSAATETKHIGRMIVDCPVIVEPRQTQLGAAEKRWVPEALEARLFQTGMNDYAIIDAARVFGLPEVLDAADVPFECLYSGDAAREYRDVAPYLVSLSPNSEITRRLFSADAAPLGWWNAYPAAFIRSPQPLKAVRRHFRKYTRLQAEDGSWVLFRFWEGNSLVSLVTQSVWDDQKAYFALDHEYSAVRRMSDGDAWVTMRWAP